MKFFSRILLVFILLVLTNCKKDDEINTLTVSTKTLTIPAEGGSTTFIIETDAESWTIENSTTDWINLSVSSGTTTNETILISVNSKTYNLRTGILSIKAGNAEPIEITVSQDASDFLYELETSLNQLVYDNSSASDTIVITSNAPKWNLSCDADWVKLSQQNGAEGTFNVILSVSNNTESTFRETTIALTGKDAPTAEIKLTQQDIYVSYNFSPADPDITGMSSTAMEIAGKIKIGWNCGNTLEAIGGETNWGNPKINSMLMQLVKNSGFNAVRLPCSYDQYANQETAEIQASWLDRVKEVVQLCVNEGLYVVLNIHWDGGWLENNCTPAKQDENNAKQKAFWEQIATHLRDFDEHLIFASANEPNVNDYTGMQVLLSYHQTFVNAVRTTGGKNSYRVLVLQGPSTDIEKTYSLMNTLPTDQADNKLMTEIHYYTPYQFCLMTEDADWGNMFYYWGKDNHSPTDTKHNPTWGEESTLNNLFKRMKVKYVDKGIPVILGEFTAIRRSALTGEDLNLHLDSRAYFFEYLVKQAKTNGLLPFYWDAGNKGVNASALFDRQNNTVYDKQALDALMAGLAN